MLDSAVDKHYRFLPLAVHLNIAAADFRHKVLGIRVIVRNIGRTVDKYLSKHRTVLAQVLCKRARVHAVYAGYFLLLEPVGKTSVSLPVAMVPRIILCHDSLAVYMLAFVVFADIIFFSARGHSVITEYRIGRNQYLTFIRRVGKTLGISGHSRIENDLTGNRLFVAKRLSFKNSSVFEYEDGLSCLSHTIEINTLKTLTKLRLSIVKTMQS